MSLRRQLLASLGLQGAGSAAVLLAMLYLGVRVGPEAQGEFSRTKTEIEFIAAAGMLGLPQSLFFYVKSGRLSENSALRWVLGSSVLALLLGTGYALLQLRAAGALAVALFAAAVGMCVAHAQLRALVLVRQRTEWFNLLTALPQALILFGVIGLVNADVSMRPAVTVWAPVFAFAYGIATAWAWQRLRHSPDGMLGAGGSRRDIARYGVAAWLTAVFVNAAILVAQRVVEHAAGLAALGQFTLAMALVQVPLTPISYAAPLLLRRWMERPGGAASRRWAGKIFASMIGVALLIWLIAPWWPDLGMGEAYAGATRALAVLLAGGAAEAVSRLLVVQASAIGRPWVGVKAEAARWFVLAVGWTLPLPNGLLTMCAIWAVAAGAAALVFVGHARLAGAVAGRIS